MRRRASPLMQLCFALAIMATFYGTFAGLTAIADSARRYVHLSIGRCWQHKLTSADGMITVEVRGCPGGGIGTGETLYMAAWQDRTPRPITDRAPSAGTFSIREMR